jgi:transposase
MLLIAADGRHTFIYLDNLRVHHGKLVMEWIKDKPLTFIFAPIYSSEYNPIERLWAMAKRLFTQKLVGPNTPNIQNEATIQSLIK